MPWFGVLGVGADDVAPCPKCGADAVATRGGGFFGTDEYVCDECGYEPRRSVVHTDRPEGVTVTVEPVDGGSLDVTDAYLGADADALVLRDGTTDGDSDSTRLPLDTVDFDTVAVDENPESGVFTDAVVRVPRSGTRADLLVAPRGQADLIDVLFLLATADPTSEDPTA